MQLQKEVIPFDKTTLFTKLFLDYVSDNGRKKLTPFYSYEPSYNGIEKFMAENNYAELDRTLLATELLHQNKQLILSEATQKNIEALQNKNTYTLVTGHQLCLATGPAYFIYKILSAINLSEELNKKFSAQHFVPVYWMASEDHDFEEVNHIHLFNKKISWQSTQKGSVGAFSTDGIHTFLAEIKESLGESDAAIKIFQTLETAYSKPNLADATRYLVNELFGSYGLIIIDGNSAPLKKEFTEEIKKELFENFSYKKVNETNAKLSAEGYGAQVSPREINLFYADKGLRERIVFENDSYKILNTNLSFTREEIQKLTETDIHKFSPNVVLRPLYQQKILPNAAYVGGPGELAYWLQYKAMFHEAQVPFPVLVPRNFVLFADKGISQKKEKLGLETESLFEEKNTLIKNYALQQNPFSLEEEKERLKELFAGIKKTISLVDKTLEGSTESELQKSMKSLETLEQKGIRAIKQKNEQAIRQIETIYERLFPNGLPQERYENFMRFYVSDPDFINAIKENTSSFINEKGIVFLSEK